MMTFRHFQTLVYTEDKQFVKELLNKVVTNHLIVEGLNDIHREEY